MAFKSQAQRRYLFATHPKVAKEFARATPKGAKLPERAKRKNKSIPQMYQDATKGLQNYGQNIRKNMEANYQDWKSGKMPNYGGRNIFPNPLNPASYKSKKGKISVNNKMKGSLGRMNPKTNKVEINVRAHKGDRAELASTIKHEMMHVKHPKMTEKEVYKRTAKTKIKPSERQKLLAKLKSINYRRGAAKRKLGLHRGEGTKPGELLKRLHDISK